MPLAWHVIGYLFLTILITSFVFLIGSSYARVETVAGTVTLDKGVATIVPSRPGVVAAVEVGEGERVRAGNVLVRVRSEEDMIGGDTAPSRIRRSIEEQNARLTMQGAAMRAVSHAEKSGLRDQISGLSAEVTGLAQQIQDQRRLLDVATADYDTARQVAAKGFISRRDLDARQATILLRRQQLVQFGQTRASKLSAIAGARKAIAQADAAAEVQVAGAQSTRAALATHLAEADLARGYALTAPFDGTVTAMVARAGQATKDGQQLMMIVPDGARPLVELYVPPASAGFIKPGQKVRLAIDAFPYQQFGTVPAHVTSVSAMTVARPGPDGTETVYLVEASLDRPWIDAFGQRRMLNPGMTLTARIATDTRSLLEWLFQPLFAVGKRYRRARQTRLADARLYRR